MKKKLILFLVRKNLGLKKKQKFCFVNQQDKDNEYYFADDFIAKKEVSGTFESHLSLNFLLSEKCKRYLIKKDDFA